MFGAVGIHKGAEIDLFCRDQQICFVKNMAFNCCGDDSMGLFEQVREVAWL